MTRWRRVLSLHSRIEAQGRVSARFDNQVHLYNFSSLSYADECVRVLKRINPSADVAVYFRDEVAAGVAA